MYLKSLILALFFVAANVFTAGKIQEPPVSAVAEALADKFLYEPPKSYEMTEEEIDEELKKIDSAVSFLGKLIDDGSDYIPFIEAAAKAIYEGDLEGKDRDEIVGDVLSALIVEGIKAVPGVSTANIIVEKMLGVSVDDVFSAPEPCSYTIDLDTGEHYKVAEIKGLLPWEVEVVHNKQPGWYAVIDAHPTTYSKKDHGYMLDQDFGFIWKGDDAEAPKRVNVLDIYYFHDDFGPEDPYKAPYMIQHYFYAKNIKPQRVTLEWNGEGEYVLAEEAEDWEISIERVVGVDTYLAEIKSECYWDVIKK